MVNKKEEANIKVKQIENYCEEYQEWPKIIKKPNNEKEELSSDLAKWIIKSNYLNKKKPFKYQHLLDEQNKELIITLDYYYFKYGINSIWEAKDSPNIATSSYYYILAIYQELENHKDDLASYYYEALKQKLNTENSDFDLEEIMTLLKQNIDKILSYFLEKYMEVSKDNRNKWTFFYKNLYSYFLLQKEKQMKEQKS